MTTVRGLVLLFGLASFLVGALIYGWLRAWGGVVGIDAVRLLRTAAFVLVFMSMFTSPLVMAGGFLAVWFGRRCRLSADSVLVQGGAYAALWASVMAGCLAAEIAITIDEQRFIADVEARTPPAQMDRDRIWPFEGFGMHYAPDRGYWTTD